MPVVSFNSNLGGWQVDYRGHFATKALAEASIGKQAAPSGPSSAEFKQAHGAVMNVKAPPKSPEEQAVDQLATLRASRAALAAKKAPALLLRTYDTQIAAIYKKYPNIAKREDAAKASNKAKFQRYQAQYLKGRAADAKRSKEIHDWLMANDPQYAADQKYIASAGTDWSIFVAGAKVIAAGAAVIATGGAAAGALAGGLTVASAITAAASAATAIKTTSSIVQGKPPPLSESLNVPGVSNAVKAVTSTVSAAADVKAVVDTAKDIKAVVDSVRQSVPVTQSLAAASVVDKLSKSLAVDASGVLSSVSSLAGDAANVEGLRVLADKVIAAQEKGGTLATQAAAIVRATQTLASAGDARATAALRTFAEVQAQRAKAGLARGVEQAITSTGARSLAAFIAAAAGIKVALQPVVTVRSEQPAAIFEALPNLVRPAADLFKDQAQLFRSSAAAPAAPAKPPAPVPVPRPVAAPAPAVVQTEQGFVVTSDARVLDGTRWRAVDSDAPGSNGFLVRTTGPAALRRDSTVRRWAPV